MAGARPSSFKKAGGFLNGVDATITGYRLTDEFLGEAFKPGKFKGSDGKLVDRPHALYSELAVRVDGADEDTLVPLKLSNQFDQWEVSEDEHTLTPSEDGQALSQSAAFQKFIESLCNPANGDVQFPEDLFPEDEFNWEAMIGTRVRLVQRVDAARTKEFGKRKGKNGKEYDRQDLVVDQVYELPEAEGGKKAKKGTKPAPAAAGKKGKPAPEPEPDEDVDVSDDAVKALKRYLKAAPGKTLGISKLRMKVLTDATFKDDTDLRDGVASYLAGTDNLESIDGVTYNEKKQTVTLD